MIYILLSRTNFYRH